MLPSFVSVFTPFLVITEKGKKRQEAALSFVAGYCAGFYLSLMKNLAFRNLRTLRSVSKYRARKLAVGTVRPGQGTSKKLNIQKSMGPHGMHP